MRLFVAVWPPPKLVAAVEAALVAGERSEAVDRRLRWTPPGKWHVTLRFLGEAEVEEARACFRSVRHAPVAAALGPAIGAFGRRVLHVPVAGLDALAGAVVAATAAVGRPPDGRPFAGHLTLARARSRDGADLRPWRGAAVSGSWTVGELTLVASTTAPGGGGYEVVDRLALE